MEGSLAYLRALLCQRGLDEMRRRATRRWNGSARPAPTARRCCTPGRVPTCSKATSTEPTCSSPSRGRGGQRRREPFVAVVFAERGMVAIERDDWPEAEALATQALAIIEDGEFDDYWTSALVCAWARALCPPRRRAEARTSRHGRLASGPAHPRAAGRARSRRCSNSPARTSRSPTPEARGRAETDRRHPAASASSWVCAEAGDRAASRLETLRGEMLGRLLADDGRTAAASAVAHAPLVGGDQRAAVRLAEHGQDASDLDLSEVRRVDSRPDGHAQRTGLGLAAHT